MDRLQAELRRLYAADPVAAPALDGPALVDAGGRVRAIVLELARPADGQALWAVWQRVQAELELPAPAIAVNGQDGCQLWFSLADPVPAAQAQAWADALHQRWLGDARAGRITSLPRPDATAPGGLRHAAAVPAPQPGGERWSAFVAPDLAPVFAAEPWLDLPPGGDGQARLLAGLGSIAPADFQRTLDLLRQPPAGASPPAGGDGPAPAAPASPAAASGPAAQPEAPPAPAATTASDGTTTDIRPAPATAHRDPRRFLLDVMHDGQVPLALRIEAAKALLAAGEAAPRG